MPTKQPSWTDWKVEDLRNGERTLQDFERKLQNAGRDDVVVVAMILEVLLGAEIAEEFRRIDPQRHRAALRIAEAREQMRARLHELQAAEA